MSTSSFILLSTKCLSILCNLERYIVIFSTVSGLILRQMMTSYTGESACEVIVVHAVSVELSAGPDVNQFLYKISLNNFDTKFNVNVM